MLIMGAFAQTTPADEVDNFVLQLQIALETKRLALHTAAVISTQAGLRRFVAKSLASGHEIQTLDALQTTQFQSIALQPVHPHDPPRTRDVIGKRRP